MSETNKEHTTKLLLEKYEPIAIVGMSMRFPGGNEDPDAFARMLQNKQDAITPIPLSRWNNEHYFSEKIGEAGKITTHSGGYIEHFDEFDPGFFSISPKEASHMDPQQRVILELAWEALEHANINPDEWRGKNTGVFIGASTIDYAKETTGLTPTALVSPMGTGTANSAISGRIAYFFGFRGPCLTVDTACSSSLVALHLSMQALRARESDAVLCGAVNIIHHPYSHIIFSLSNMLAKDGKCKTFDSRADGYGRSEGAAVLVLKRLSDALDNQNTILGILRGSSVLQDGESGGLTVPNGTAQQRVMEKAIANALMTPKEISYVEAHGTGTPLGDPIEMQAIHQVFSEHFTHDQPLYVGSVKTNLGHMESAAGLGGIIKIILQFQHSILYPHLNLKTPSPHIPWETMPICVPNSATQWKVKKKRALVNSFGFTGTIASIVIEEPPSHNIITQKTELNEASMIGILTISAKNKDALRVLVDRYWQRVHSLSETIASLCVATNVARQHMAWRMSAVVRTKSELLHFLEEAKNKLSANVPDNFHIKFSKYKERGIAFLFSGQGSQYTGMGKILYQHFSIFREAMNECDKWFITYTNTSIKEIINQTGEDIHQTLYTQPALFSLEYSLAKLWMHWGIQPDVLIGHSIGEITAATIAGVFTLEDAIKMVVVRAKLMHSVKLKGIMAAIHADSTTVERYLATEKNVSIAAINSPSQVVISGSLEAVFLLCEKFKAAHINYTLLKVSQAFHSSHMDEILHSFEETLSSIRFNVPTIALISNVTGKLAEEKILSISYWSKHIREPVNFFQGVKEIEKKGQHLFIEIGPNSFLCNLTKQSLGSIDTLFLPSILQGEHEIEVLYKSVQALYQAGYKIQWQNVNKNLPRPTISLPRYPFIHKRYWLPAGVKSHQQKYAHPLLGQKSKFENGIIEYISEITPTYPEYLSHHVVMNKIVFPGASYIELLLALQDDIFGETNWIIKELSIIEPLFLQEGGTTQLRVQLKKITSTEYAVEIFSQSILHVTTSLQKKPYHRLFSLFDAFSEKDDLSFYQKLLKSEIYETLHNKGLEYGSLFKRVEWVERCSRWTAKGVISQPEIDSFEFLHPTILDGVLHTIDAVLNVIEPNKTILPVGWGELIFLKKPKSQQLKSQIQLKPNPKEGATYLADLVLSDDYGTIFLVEDLKLKVVSGAISKTNKELRSHLLYCPKWMLETLTLNSTISPFSSIIFFNEARFFNKEIKSSFMSKSIEIIEMSELNTLCAYLTHDISCRDIVYFWTHGFETIETSCEFNFKAILSLIHTLEKSSLEQKINLTFVTVNGIMHPLNTKNNEISFLAQGTLLGFESVLSNEHPRFNSRIIDIDLSFASSQQNYEQLINEIANREAENEQIVVYRLGKRYVRRLDSLETNKLSKQNIKLAIAEFGTFANIVKQDISIRYPEKDEILVKVMAAGLNFKDVINVLGLLKKQAEESNIEYRDLPLGFECSGIVIRSGPQATFLPGDEVIISHLGCMQKFLTVSSVAAVKKPKSIGFNQAAGLATAYITSYYALHYLAKIKPNNKILIHAAAGGVGQAAVYLAKQAGAEIFATASAAKWEHLKKQGIKHIGNSRDLTFSNDVKSATNGEGVDIVLNSLNKEFIPTSVDLLVNQGRFIELGKIGIWPTHKMKEYREDIQYFNFDLSELSTSDLNRLNNDILQKVVNLIERGEIDALPITVFPLSEISAAFSMLSRGNNIGKIVLSFNNEEEIENSILAKISPDFVYLITGGYGSLGRKMIKWLANNGAKKIALVGRQLPKMLDIMALKKEIDEEEIKLIPLQGDISEQSVVQTIYHDIEKQYGLIGGIIHTAGILDDVPINSLTWEKMHTVFKPKVYGTYYLHKEATQLTQLNFFLCYSSVASLAGSLGQANYAAANAFIDNLMANRTLNGQHGMAINWGPWAEVGMAATLDKRLIQSIEDKGMKFIKPHLAMESLGTVFSSFHGQVIIGEFDWLRYQQSLSRENKLFSLLLKNRIKIDLREAKIDWNAIAIQDRLSQVMKMVRYKLSIILHFIDEKDIPLDSRFSELGLDSLVSVEFKNVLEKEFGVILKTSIAYDYPSIPLISEYLVTLLWKEDKKNNRLAGNKLKKMFTKLVHNNVEG